MVDEQITIDLTCFKPKEKREEDKGKLKFRPSKVQICITVWGVFCT